MTTKANHSFDAFDYTTVHKHVYTEVEFHACLLVNGFYGAFEYWDTVDEWFKTIWPKRFDYYAEAHTIRRQMEFKIQFFNWAREEERKLTQCVTGESK